MNRYRPGVVKTGMAHPKPVRQKRSARAWRRAKLVEEDGRLKVQPDHETLLAACVEVLDMAGISYRHIRDEAYRLISSDALSIAQKAALADCLKGLPDLMVWFQVPGQPVGVSLSYQCDVKTGAGKLNAAQRRWRDQTAMDVTRHVDDFRAAIARCQKIAEEAGR